MPPFCSEGTPSARGDSKISSCTFHRYQYQLIHWRQFLPIHLSTGQCSQVPVPVPQIHALPFRSRWLLYYMKPQLQVQEKQMVGDTIPSLLTLGETGFHVHDQQNEVTTLWCFYFN